MSKPQMATKLLEKDHRIVRRLLQEFERSDPKKPQEKLEIYGQLFHELEMHARIEREFLYGALEKDRPAEVRQACRRQVRIDRLLKDLGRREPGDRAFDEGMRALKTQVESHILHEKDTLFPAAEQVLGPRQLEDMAVLVAARKSKWNEGGKE